MSVAPWVAEGHDSHNPDLNRGEMKPRYENGGRFFCVADKSFPGAPWSHTRTTYITKQRERQLAKTAIDDKDIRQFYDHRSQGIMFRDAKGRIGGTAEELDKSGFVSKKLLKQKLKRAEGVYTSQSRMWKQKRKRRPKLWPPTPEQSIIAL